MNKKGLRQHNKAFYYTVETNYLQAYKTVSKTENPRVGGSIPPRGTTKPLSVNRQGFFLCKNFTNVYRGKVFYSTSYAKDVAEELSELTALENLAILEIRVPEGAKCA